MTGYVIPMQPKGFRRLRRLIWTFRAFLEFRSRLNGDSLLNSAEPWPLATLWSMAEAAAQNEADSNDRDGYRWDTPAEAVQGELECWDE